MEKFKNNSFWLTFRLDDMDCCILSDYVRSIDIPSEIKPLPDSPKTVTGVTRHDDLLIPVIEMREIYGRMNLKNYLEQFTTMKTMHLTWIEDLERYIREGGTFTKPVDPHRCQFGIWYDGFETENDRLNRLLLKIVVPHARIHECGKEVVRLKNSSGDHKEEIETLLEEAINICKNDMIPLLDRLITVYKSANRGVILVVNKGSKTIGLLVDEVKTLIPANKTTPQEFNDDLTHSPYLSSLVAYGEQMFVEININRLLGLETIQNATPLDNP